MTVGELIEGLQDAGLTAEQIVTVVTLASRYAVTTNRDGRSKEAERARRYRLGKSAKSGAAKANDVAASVVTGVTDGFKNQLMTLSKDSDSRLSKTEERKKESDSVNGRANVSRGTRLEQWAVAPNVAPAAFINFATTEGMTVFEAHKAWTEFVDYWVAIPGQRGRKTDWFATWRNRVRQLTGGKRAKAKQSLSDVAFDLADEARELERKAGLDRSPDDFGRD